MVERLGIGKLTGTVVQQRAWLRANLVNRLFRLGNALHVQTQDLLSRESDLSVVHFRIMLRLTQAGPQNVQGIADLLGTDRSNISRALPTLLKNGWIEQRASQDDRRQSIVTLTEAGARKVKNSRKGIDARLEALRAAFSDQEFDQLLTYMDRLDTVLAIPAEAFAEEDSNIVEMARPA